MLLKILSYAVPIVGAWFFGAYKSTNITAGIKRAHDLAVAEKVKLQSDLASVEAALKAKETEFEDLKHFFSTNIT